VLYSTNNPLVGGEFTPKTWRPAHLAARAKTTFPEIVGGSMLFRLEPAERPDASGMIPADNPKPKRTADQRRQLFWMM
jgi:hypothetical protein